MLPADKKEENLNHTFYRDQINKVANAIKEIGTGLKGSATQISDIKPSPDIVENLSKGTAPVRSKKRMRLAAIIVISLFLLGGWWWYRLKYSTRDAAITKSIRDSRKVKWAKLTLDYGNAKHVEPKYFFLAYAYYLAGQLPESLRRYEELYKSNSNLWLLSQIGCINSKLGNREQAKAIIKKLEHLKDPHLHGMIKYSMGRIYAALGEKEKSMENLREASGEQGVWPFFYDEDLELLPLFDYPPFQEFVKPRG